MGTGRPANRFMATACAVIQTTARAMASKSSHSVTPPKAMTKLLAQAGGCGQDSRTRSKQDTARASDALQNSGQPPVSVDTGLPARALMRCQIAHPDAKAEKWPRMTERGAAAFDMGALKRTNAAGPSAGKMRGRSMSQAKKPMARMANPPLIAATSDTTLRSSNRASKAGVLNRARQIVQRERTRVFPSCFAVGC